jgi:pimeloyl-ACP methyl ester carboxylesterase
VAIANDDTVKLVILLALPMTPISIFRVWFLGLLSLCIIAGAIYLGYEWQQRSWGWDPILQVSTFSPHFGVNEETMIFAGAAILGVFALAGGTITKGVLRVSARAQSPGEPDPREAPTPREAIRLRRPDGSEIQVNFYGPEDGIPIVLTHGWGLNSNEWNYLKKELSNEFRLITWDLPGLGRSTRPRNRDYSVEKFASDLKTVLELAGNKPAILLGHSIGGMITLTFCRLFPEELKRRVAGLVLTHTTPTDPIRTTSGAAFFTAIEKPVLVPLMYLTMVLSPLVWLMNWLSYWNGSLHLSTKRSSFGGTETWEQIDFAASFQPIASPAVLARGMLGMMRYDARETLGEIPVPALVVAGSRDSTTKPRASDQISAGIFTSQLITLDPAKHLGLIEHHAKYARIVREFSHTVQPKIPVTVLLPTATAG